jgi:hypothetical protein
MSTFTPEHPKAQSLAFEGDSLVVVLTDGRELKVPLEWYPSLRDATAEERANFRMIGGGVGIHWPELDEDLSVRGFLMPNALSKTG